MAKPPRLDLVGRVDLPVAEASSVFVAPRTEGDRLLVVGDRTSVVAVSTMADGRPGTWEQIDLSDVPGWPEHAGDSQFEAVTSDGGALVAFMREDPAEVLVVDTAERRLRAHIRLLVPAWSALAGKWDDPSSRGEGLVLLRGGRMLVAKEKRPRALVEFGPAGTSPLGVGRHDLLDADEDWSAPEGDVSFHALAVWKLKGVAKKALGDVSALAVSRDRDLWLLSDKSAAVARIDLGQRLPPGGGVITSLDETHRLPRKTTKPEGFAMLDADTALIALDTPRPQGNGLLVRRPSPDASEEE